MGGGGAPCSQGCSSVAWLACCTTSPNNDAEAAAERAATASFHMHVFHQPLPNLPPLLSCPGARRGGRGRGRGRRRVTRWVRTCHRCAAAATDCSVCDLQRFACPCMPCHPCALVWRCLGAVLPAVALTERVREKMQRAASGWRAGGVAPGEQGQPSGEDVTRGCAAHEHTYETVVGAGWGRVGWNTENRGQSKCRGWSLRA